MRVSLIVGFVSVAAGMLSVGPWGSSRVIGADASTASSMPARRAAGLSGHRGRGRHRGLLGPALPEITVILGVATIPLLYRVVRATTLSYANRDFVVAARTLGAKDPRILFREILRCAPAAVSFGLITVAIVIVLEVARLSGPFVALPTPSWGTSSRRARPTGPSSNPFIVLAVAGHVPLAAGHQHDRRPGAQQVRRPGGPGLMIGSRRSSRATGVPHVEDLGRPLLVVENLHTSFRTSRGTSGGGRDPSPSTVAHPGVVGESGREDGPLPLDHGSAAHPERRAERVGAVSGHRLDRDARWSCARVGSELSMIFRIR